jgi:hypothetical protein
MEEADSRLSGRFGRYKKPSRLPKKRLCAIVAATLVAVSLLAVYSFHSQPSNNDEPRAAIIDQLSSMGEFTNATFVKTATNMLTAAGYQVTYYKGSDVNVEFYRSLPENGYKLLIFRVHSALRFNSTPPASLIPPLDFFTSEKYSPGAYVSDQTGHLLDIALYNVTSKDKYFGIPPSFVTGAMEGSFQGATIILEGCNGLDGQGRSKTMLQALVYKGAKVIIGWNDSVSVNHTDTAVEDLLDSLLAENETVKEAVNETNSEIAPDYYNNKLLYYPSTSTPFYCGVDTGNYTIPHGSSKSTAAETSDNYALSSANESVLAVLILLSVKGPGTFRKFRKMIF